MQLLLVLSCGSSPAPSPASSVLLRCPHSDPKMGLCAFVPGVFSPGLCWIGSAPTENIPSGIGCRAPLPPLPIFLLSNSSPSPTLPPLQPFLLSSSSSTPGTALSRPWKCSRGFCLLLPGSSALLSPPAPGAEDLLGALLQLSAPVDVV